ncbi:hypothetical protein CTAYLR_002556 [Chrysophaeum taylorii]|uniref:CRAL-TRIO domain-containing protein n=1 Tax=Chrysophaeum taylorii TaxID=2483200 RepID=A0AAD7UF56_9STRA|nr:hypothetical protein CTAYLR_002556 [Chrysophaeum taylorii]
MLTKAPPAAEALEEDDNDDEAALWALAHSQSENIVGPLAELYGFAADDEAAALSQLLRRFARARRGSPKKALKFLLSDVEWRKKMDVPGLRRLAPHDVLESEPSLVRSYYERLLVGVDRRGRPVYYQTYRRFLVKELLKLAPHRALERYHIWEQERACAVADRLRRRGVGSGALSVVLDLEGMTLQQHVDADFLRLIKSLAVIDQNHYPERMGCTVVVNAPRAFWFVWSVVKPWLDPVTADKIRIYEEKSWRPSLGDLLGEHIVDAIDRGTNFDDVVSDLPMELDLLEDALFRSHEGRQHHHPKRNYDTEAQRLYLRLTLRDQEPCEEELTPIDVSRLPVPAVSPRQPRPPSGGTKSVQVARRLELFMPPHVVLVAFAFLSTVEVFLTAAVTMGRLLATTLGGGHHHHHRNTPGGQFPTTAA